MRALDLTTTWPVPTVAAAVCAGGDVLDAVGPADAIFHLASIAKPVAAWAMLVAVEEGTIDLDTVIGPSRNATPCTLRHLLAHAGGYGFDTAQPIVAPERKRIYSNTGIELAADAVAVGAGMPFDEYLRLGVLEPLGMTSTELRGSPATGLWSTIDDLARFAAEVTFPTLISTETAATAVRPHFAALGGIVPGVGRFDTCPWGLGFEVRGDKTPHWTGSRNSAATFGHFGGAGTLMWTDPAYAAGVGEPALSLIALTDRRFDDWSAEALHRWPELSDAVIEEFAGVR